MLNQFLLKQAHPCDSSSVWNTLPAELRQPDIELVTFRRLLKTHLFKCDPGA